MFEIIKRYPEVNKYTRPGFKIRAMSGVIVHWTGTPRATADNIADAFDRNTRNGVYASANYIVGIDGKIIEYIPFNEVAYQSGASNRIFYTPTAKAHWSHEAESRYWYPYFFLIGIECCHRDLTGRFTIDTLLSLEWLLIHLWHQYDYGDMISHIHRHTDITRKGRRGLKDNNNKPELPCPRWFVENPYDWEKFLLQVKSNYIQSREHGCMWPF